MKYFKLKHFNTLGILVLVTYLVSCTDVSESLRSETTPDGFFDVDEHFVSSLGDAYGPLASMYGSNSALGGTMIANDDMVITQRGADWEDGGIWIRLHEHTFRPDNIRITQLWETSFSGVSNSNRLIFQFEDLIAQGEIDAELGDPFIAELRGMRAFYYYILLDNFGNVPIVTSFAEAEENPAQPSSDFQEGRRQVFDFVESEFLAILDQLNDQAGSATYGRMNKWVAHYTLAKLYLNAETYIGEERWDEVIEHTNAIMNSGNYSLMSNYADNFLVENSGSPENIFVIPYDKSFLTGFNLHKMSFHPAAQAALKLNTGSWSGYQVLTEHYASYIDPELNPGPQGTVIDTDIEASETTGTIDQRTDVNIWYGPINNPDGSPVMDPQAQERDPDGPRVTITPFILELFPNDLRQSGGRVKKYEIEEGLSGNNMDNDYVIQRYSDVLLTKAEALWRKNPADAEALQLVNQVRTRAGVDPYDQLTADLLLAERGRETFYEMVRRQDLIRFEGKVGETRWNDPWRFKEASESYRNVFPVPRNQLENNPNLVQNPGY